jgi:hypothetical protein
MEKNVAMGNEAAANLTVSISFWSFRGKVFKKGKDKKNGNSVELFF